MTGVGAPTELCNRCGYCQALCPVFLETGLERTVARGRLALIEQWRARGAELGVHMQQVLYDCTLCGRCHDTCPAGLDVPGLIMGARCELAGSASLLDPVRRLMDALLPRPALLEVLNVGLRVYQGTGLRGLMRRLAVASGPERLLPASIGRSFRSGGAAGGPSGARLVYFLGCGTNLLHPNVARSTLAVLQQTGPVRVANNGCCGLPARVYGNRRLAERLARDAVGELVDAELVITDCASCASSLKALGSVLEGDPHWAEPARALAGRVRGLSEYLLSVGYDVGRIDAEITVHHPCHMVRYQHNAPALDAVLEGAGAVLRPPADVGACCGAAGTFALTNPGLSDAILKRRAQELVAAGGSAVVTECPACLTQLARGLGEGLAVRHVAEIIAQAIT